MAVLPGFNEETALQVYRYDSNGPNWLLAPLNAKSSDSRSRRDTPEHLQIPV